MTDLNAVIGADEVLIYGLEPAHIVMGVTHQVHIQLPIHKRGTGVVESGSELQELRILLLSSSIKPPTTDDDPEKRLQQPQEADHIPPPRHHYPPTHHLCAPLLLFLLLPVPSQNTHTPLDDDDDQQQHHILHSPNLDSVCTHRRRSYNKDHRDSSSSSSSNRKEKKAEPLFLQSFNPSSKTLLYTNQQREWMQPNSNNCLYFVSPLEAGGSNKHGRSVLVEMGVYGMAD